MHPCTCLCTLTLLGTVGGGSSWPRVQSTLYPYTIQQPPGFQHSVVRDTDVFTAPSATVTIRAAGESRWEPCV
jgi:hypothetical protein